MDETEHHLQSLGICSRLYNFIVKTLARQALKTVALGRPLRHGFTQKPINPVHLVHPMAQEPAHGDASVRTKTNPEPAADPIPPASHNQDKPSRELLSSQATDSDIRSSAQQTEKNAQQLNHRKMKQEEATLPSLTPQAKAPKKMVSINENVEVINSSTKKMRKKKSTEKLPSFEAELSDPKPLKSILKVSSSLNENSFINGNSTSGFIAEPK